MTITSRANEAHDHPVTGKRTGLGGIAHTHDLAPVDAAIAALDARISALNAAVEDHEARLDVLEEEPIPPPSDAAPIISGVAVSAINQTGARVSWSLSEPCTGRVEYGKTTAYGTLSTLESNLLSSHSQVLAGLTADTLYHFRVRSKDSAGQEAISPDSSFRTLAAVITPPPPTGGTRVTSVAALLTALADNSVTDIVVANGTYRVSIAAAQRADSLWIGARFAGRTAPVTVRAETKGGVIFDGGGANTFGGITFTAGSHDQTWDGFVFANGTPCGPDGQGSGTGMVVIGGYSGMAATHHITLRNITLKPTQGTYLGGHGVYFSWSSAPGPHNITIDGLTISAAGVYMTSGVTFYHSDATNPNAHDVLIKNVNLTAKAVDQGLLPWDNTLDNLTFEDWLLTGIRIGCQYECSSAVQGVVFRRWNSTGSEAGWVSTKGNPPPGVTFIDSSFK